MIKRKILLGVISIGVSSLAFAAGDTFVAPPAPATTFSPGVYLGIQGGYGLTGWDNVDKAMGSRSVEVSGANAFAGRAYLGYDFHPNFAVEAGYTQFFNDTTIKGGFNIQKSDPKYNYAIDLVGKLKANIVDNFGLFAKAGIDYLATNEGLDGKRHDALNVVYGAGAFWNITQSFAADLAWMRYSGNSKWSNDYQPYADLFTLGLSYKFNLS